MSCATPILPSGPLGHVPEMPGHVAEIAGHHPETAGHVRPKYALSATRYREEALAATAARCSTVTPSARDNAAILSMGVAVYLGTSNRFMCITQYLQRRAGELTGEFFVHTRKLFSV